MTRMIGIWFLAALLCAVVPLYLGVLERQDRVTFSSMETEYDALGYIVKEALFVKEVLISLVPGIGKSPIAVFEDNVGAIRPEGKPLGATRSRHINVRCHFLREKGAEGKIFLS